MARRKPINPGVWLIGGAVLSVMSYIINGRSISGKMALFFWIGIAFLVYGFARIGYRRLVGRPKPEKVKEEVPKTIEEMQKAAPTYFCPGCGSRLRETDVFCARCGRKVRA